MYEELVKFFDMHLAVWEPGHEIFLRKASYKYLSPESYGLFEEGFKTVMQIMDTWWNGLDKESRALRS